MRERKSRSSCWRAQDALFRGKTETRLGIYQHRTFQPRRGTVRMRLSWVAVAPARQTRTCLINGYGGLGWITKSGEFQSSRYIKKRSTQEVTRWGGFGVNNWYPMGSLGHGLSEYPRWTRWSFRESGSLIYLISLG